MGVRVLFWAGDSESTGGGNNGLAPVDFLRPARS